ncbi:hypothetical protein [Thaumasiovibrio subtropicus]|uniref:hypothetical protein n=1 Tax=Thaumasiovibrio subtropicus TaxID=1891207 RepID=UPI000B362095|nr:hypothetical protein [Thaumasiovibrio subtropicus]
MKKLFLLSALLMCFFASVSANEHDFPTLEEQVESKEVRDEVLSRCLKIKKSVWPKACHENIEANKIVSQRLKDERPPWLKL